MQERRPAKQRGVQGQGSKVTGAAARRTSPERPAAVLLQVVLGPFAVVRGQVKLCGPSNTVCQGRLEAQQEKKKRRRLTVLAEDRRGDQILEDAPVSLKGTDHLAPHQELAHLLRQFPEFLLGRRRASEEATRGRHGAVKPRPAVRSWGGGEEKGHF